MGFILLDKPAGITSHDVAREVRRISHKKKVGHAGTLDPFATGLLIIMLEKATRLAEYLLDLPKTYITTIILGATSDTDDITGHISQGAVPAVADKRRLGVPSQQEIENTLHYFVGTIQQVPPAYAATKIKGRRAYVYAREGERIEQAARKISIYELTLLDYQYPKLKLRVTGGRGTYIRALARDIGAALKTGAYCSTLCRLAIGQFAVKDAYKLTNLPTELSTAIQPIELLVNHLPKITLSANNVAKFRQGKAVAVSTNLTPITTHSVLDASAKLIGLGRPDPSSPTLLRPHKVFDN